MMRSCCRALVLALAAGVALAPPPMTGVAYSPDGEQIVAISQNGLTIHDGKSLEILRLLMFRMPQTTAVQFSPSGKRLVVVGGAPAEWGGVHILDWPVPDNVDPQLLSVADDVLYGAVWLSETQLALAGSDGEFSVFNAEGNRLRTMKGHSGHVMCVATLDGGKTLITGGGDSSVRVWNGESGALLRTLSNHTAEVRDLAARPANEGLPMIASAGKDKTVRLWQPTIGRLVRFARLESAPLAIAWTPDGKSLLAACEDGGLRVIDPAAVRVVRHSPAFDGWARAVAASPDGRQAAIAGENGQLRRISLDSVPQAAAQP